MIQLKCELRVSSCVDSHPQIVSIVYVCLSSHTGDCTLCNLVCLPLPTDCFLWTSCLFVTKRMYFLLRSTGISNRKLEVTYKNTDSLSFQDDIGNIILHICTTVPHGVLVFAPSYALLEKLARRWKTTGLWLSLCQAKGMELAQHG